MLMNTTRLMGAIFCILSLAGSLIPGLEFRVYFGTTEGAATWHRH